MDWIEDLVVEVPENGELAPGVRARMIWPGELRAALRSKVPYLIRKVLRL